MELLKFEVAAAGVQAELGQQVLHQEMEARVLHLLSPVQVLHMQAAEVAVLTILVQLELAVWVEVEMVLAVAGQQEQILQDLIIRGVAAAVLHLPLIHHLLVVRVL